MANSFSTVPIGTHYERRSTSAFRLLERIRSPSYLVFFTKLRSSCSSIRSVPKVLLEPFDAPYLISAVSILLSSTPNTCGAQQGVINLLKTTVNDVTIPRDTDLRANRTPAPQPAFFQDIGLSRSSNLH